MIGLDGVKMSKSLGISSAYRRFGSGVDPSLIRLGLAAGHYRTDRSWSAEILEAARARHQRWSRAIACGAGADADAAIAALRARLADDLDTPGALKAIDSWAAATLEGDSSDVNAGASVATALDALLGVRITAA